MPLFICTDLDRTLIPNGPQSESPEAREHFAMLAGHPDVKVAFVTGRHRVLVDQAINNYRLSRPDFVIGDVGTSIYNVDDSGWSPWPAWVAVLEQSWGTRDGQALVPLFADIEALTPQESEKQGRFKSSYYAPVSVDVSQLKQQMQQRLAEAGLPSRIIWSIDETTDTGLVDVLPENASKLHAVRFLIQNTGHTLGNTLFAGDSGNDLEVLCSEINSVLVANATDSVRAQARQLAAQAGAADALYTARGGWRGMNGNYSAGILEGLVHFIPETEAWIA